MKESNKFLIIIIFACIFSAGIISVIGTTMSLITEELILGNPNAQMKNETFDSVTISVPASSNFKNDSYVYTDSRNRIIIQIINETILESELRSYVKTFENEMNATQINITGLNNNIVILNDTSNTTFAIVPGENKTVIIMTINQELTVNMAKSVRFDK